MKNTFKRFICLLVFGVMVCAAFSGCAGNCNGDPPHDLGKGYEITAISEGGAPLKGIGIQLSSGGSVVASGVTGDDGVIYLAAEHSVYDLGVDTQTVPKGYSQSANNPAKTAVDQPQIKLIFTSQVISEAIPENKTYAVGDVMYDFTVYDIDDNPFTLSEILAQKRMVLLNFWNLSCVPCLSEMPSLDASYRKNSVHAQVLAVDVPALGADDISHVRSYLNSGYTDVNGEKCSFTYPLCLDMNGLNRVNFMGHFPLSSIPVNAVIDRYGVLVEMHLGSMGQSQFDELFQKYTADDYSQNFTPGGSQSGGGQEELHRVEPNVTQPDSSLIEEAINDSSFKGSYVPASGTEDSKYSWPWVLESNSNEGTYLCPSNREVDYSFATISTTFTLTEDDVKADGKRVLAFDFKYSTENGGDYFFVIVNNTMVFEFTGTEHWDKYDTCYPLIATEAGEYTLTLMYNKDDTTNGGYDTVHIKNMRLITTADITADSLDMPRDTSANWTGEKYSTYVTAVKGEDGFYRLNDQNGPYILVDMYNPTNFNRHFENNSYGINTFAVNDDFNYSPVKDREDGAYRPDLDKTDAITRYLVAANAAELPGLCVVTEELKDLLIEFAKSKGADYPESWLEFCLYFEHYGTDETDKGICEFKRNPVRGLLKEAAYPMVDPHTGAFDLLTEAEAQKSNTDYDISPEYLNSVTIDRLVVPRGFKFVFEPKQDGVYRFRSQSMTFGDTMAWLRDYENEDNILKATDEQKEMSDRDYNFALTYYMKKGEKYILALSYVDPGGTGKFTFATEYLGESYYSWEQASREYVTSDESGQEMNYMYVLPVLGPDGMYYYDALRDENGNPVDKDGNIATEYSQLVADLNDPIYVNITAPNYLTGGITLGSAIEMGKTENITRRVIGFVKEAFGYDGDVAANSVLTDLNGGNEVDALKWDSLISLIAGGSEKNPGYGDSVFVQGSMVAEMKKCRTVAQLVSFLQEYYLQAFNCLPYSEFFQALGYDADKTNPADFSYIKNYTANMEGYLNVANSGAAIPQRDNQDSVTGLVQLDSTLQIIIELFARRYGWETLATDWIRLCSHFEYYGPAQS